MTKYFLVNNVSRASVYGIGTYLKQMAICLHDIKNFEPCFLDINSDAKEFEIREINGLKHYCVPACQGSYNHFLFYKSILFFLEPFLDNRQLVVFHLNFNYNYDLARVIKASYSHCRIVYTVHYLNWCFLLKGNLTKFRQIVSSNSNDRVENQRIKMEFEEDKRLFSLCDEIIVLSKFMYQLLVNDYRISESKLHLIYNGFLPEKIIRDSCEKDCHQILFVGRLDEIKGVEYIIKAFRILIQKKINVHLNLVGDGDYNRYLSLCVGIWDKVTFTGQLSWESLKHFFELSTIGVQASFHEQCSYSAIEMMAYGIPLVATDTTGLADMMEETPENMIHINELNFEENSFVYQLAGKMEKLLLSLSLRKKTIRKQMKLFGRRYHIDKMKQSVEEIFHTQMNTLAISEDFLPYLDNEMKRIIDQKPLVDFETVGLLGIRDYLLWRIDFLGKNNVDKHQIECLSEYIIKYEEWKKEISSSNFSQVKHSKMIEVVSEDGNHNQDNYIVRTALKIFNANF